MSCLEKLNTLGKEEILKKIKEAGLREYGVFNQDLYEKITEVMAEFDPEEGPMLAAGALNNHDFSGMLLKIVKEEPEKVLEGLQIISWLTDAAHTFLYLPEEETDLAALVKAKAQESGIAVEVVNDIVDARLMRDGLICHIETLKALAEVAEGIWKPSTLLSIVKYETVKEITEVKEPATVGFGTKLTDVTGSLTGIKAVGVGEKLYTPSEAAELTIEAETVVSDGVIRLYGEKCCMVDLTEKALLASRRKSCGKCTFCREGLLQLDVRMKEFTVGKADSVSLEIMKEIGQTITTSCSCSLGSCGSSLTLQTMEKFGNEYQDHLKKKCTAGTCLAFVNMYIDPKKCTGCGACITACEGDFVEGLPGYVHMIEVLDCTKCGKCIEVCPENAIVRTTSRMPKLPDRLTRVGRFKRY